MHVKLCCDRASDKYAMYLSFSACTLTPPNEGLSRRATSHTASQKSHLSLTPPKTPLQYTKNSIPPSRNLISPTNLLRHTGSISSDPHPPGFQASSVDVSGWQRNVAYHLVSTAAARPPLGHRPCYICAMLYVSQHQGLVRLDHQDAGGAVVGIPGAGGRGCEVCGGDEGGYKGVRTMSLGISLASR